MNLEMNESLIPVAHFQKVTKGVVVSVFKFSFFDYRLHTMYLESHSC